MTKYSKTDLARIAEIAYRCGVNSQMGDILLPFDDIDELWDFYTSIYDEWCNGIGKGIFLNEEEEGYACAYAERVIKERYRRKK